MKRRKREIPPELTAFPTKSRATYRIELPPKYADATDEQLVRMAQRGEADAFTQLIQRHFPVCLKRALLVLHNQSDAEEEIQNAFAKAFQNVNCFRFEGAFSAWLCRIVQNRCLMRLREKRQTGFAISIDQITAGNARLELIDQALNPEETFGAQQVDNLVRKEISRVPPLMRDVLLLREVQGLPIREVAAQLGISLTAAKSRLMRARREMRVRLLKHCGRRGQPTLMCTINSDQAEYNYVT
ncbi:MAG: sigma-70 family RNA polymerase sigma factor [Acidobacteriaceae bacterium]|nr:sigma-70 family RNA polymerase sigma factor [Acidobacteriaceae bacterium]